MTCPFIRIDTNQGIYGLGEVRDGASKNYALMLKSRLLSENPCNIDKIFRKIKQFGGHARQGGGVCGVEMALWDLAGKAYNVPVYQMLGGKFRDNIRCYADTTESHDPKGLRPAPEGAPRPGLHVAQDGSRHRSAERHPRHGHQARRASPSGGGDRTQHMFTGIELTQKGVAKMGEYVAAGPRAGRHGRAALRGPLRPHRRQ